MPDRDGVRAQLQVWDRLTVGPAQVERRRVRVPYLIEADGQRHEHLLTFRWASDVFDPAFPADHQLASLIGAQVALNYALFCRELVLHGPFDGHDRALLRDMALNTCREIFVNKLCAPNPYLIPGKLHIQAVPEPEALAGELVFPDAIETPIPAPQFGTGVAILASGGKDSLLGQGVCEEMGLEPHALFVNESGRHWFTAINAWRHLSHTRPDHTARVWTDSDRLYAFALRHLPFIRQDFDRLRNDDYPIRLWTVAPFLFAVLPMLRARKLGTLLIGDEWDSTQVADHEGIEHYCGYYDQSRFFDEAFTRYFHLKGWDIIQCSLLRPLSELLIEDILSARYPELFALQVSCHAASVVGERAVPCGRCEKCRRIVGMLVALGRDPGAIGYGPDAVQRCLGALANHGAKQAEDGQHLAALLVASGHIPADSPFAAIAQRHPGTERLRFDPLRSPGNAVPRSLRTQSWRIFLDHAKGALQQRGASWVSVDPLATDWGSRPHPFEASTAQTPAERWPEGHPTHRLGELTWPQAGRRLREVDIALLPVGAIEQHGLHLPLDIDAWDAAWQCEQVALRCSEPRPLVLPLIPFGVSYHHEDFPGTISLSPDTLSKVVYEIGMAAARNGIRKLVIVNGHGGNVPALQFAAQMINRDAHIFTMVESGETCDTEIGKLIQTESDAHAGEFETSTALATRPHLVFMEHARREVPRFSSRFLDFAGDVSVEWYVRTKRISDSGTLGDPTLATADKGRAIWEITIRNMTELVEHLKHTPLDELHRSRHRDV